MFIFGNRRMRQSSSGLFQGSTLALLGLGLNRMNVALLALQAPPGPEYLPHWIELTISLAAIAACVLLFALAERLLPVFQEVEEVEAERALPESQRSGAAQRRWGDLQPGAATERT